MVETRIKPYYLHHGDLAPGTGHLRTTLEEGQALMRSMRGAVSGLCQPTYILDIPGGPRKVPVGPDYLSNEGVEDPAGAGTPIRPRTTDGLDAPLRGSRTAADQQVAGPVGRLFAPRGRGPDRNAAWFPSTARSVKDAGRKILPGQTLVLSDGDGPAALSVVLHKPMGIVSAPAGAGADPRRASADQRRSLGQSPSIPGRDTRLAPLGRLDMDSRGLLILSDDGVLAKAIIGPESDLEKEYLVRAPARSRPRRSPGLCHGLSMDGRQLKRPRSAS
jgi:hypothetical protein